MRMAGKQLSYVTGTAGHYPLKPYVLSESTLVAAWPSASAVPRRDDRLFAFVKYCLAQRSLSGEREVICHGDAGPYNIIFRNNKPVALIDFERVTPGPRIWDIAFVVYRFAPLCDSPKQGFTPASLEPIARRIRLFLNAYGYTHNDDLFDWMRLRLKTEIDLFESGETDDPIRRQKKIEAGHFRSLQARSSSDCRYLPAPAEAQSRRRMHPAGRNWLQQDFILWSLRLLS